MSVVTGTPARWRAAARKAIGTWAPSLEVSVAKAIETAYQDGIIVGARAADAKGQIDLARELRAAARASDSRGA